MIKVKKAKLPRRMAQRALLLLLAILMTIMGSLALASSPDEEAAQLLERWLSEHGEDILTPYQDALSPEITEEDISAKEAVLIATTAAMAAYEMTSDEFETFVPFISLNTFVDGRREWNVTFGKLSPSGTGYVDSVYFTLDSTTGDVLFCIHGGRG